MGYVYSMTRFSLSEAQNHKCCYCSCEMTLEDDNSPTMATREHIIPRVFGGPTEWWNLVAACNECNTLRGHMDAQAFFWMRLKMSIEHIKSVRYERLAREDNKWRIIVLRNASIAVNFSKRWMEHFFSFSVAET